MRTKSSSKSELASQSAEDPGEKTSSEPIPGRSFALKRILVPIDFSDCSLSALGYALGLAVKFEARITLLHVVEPAVYADNYLNTPAAMEEANQSLMAAGRERLAALQRRASAQNSGGVESLVRMGRAQSDISDTAEATGSDLIVMGTHGYGGLKHLLLGSTAERVIRHAPCPVLTVRWTTAVSAAAPRKDQ
jgi:nucleotide-binding universal stress UspA family protein